MLERPEYYYVQSAVIPVRGKSADDLQLVMITSRKKKRWIIPKGIVETPLSAADSAAKEALEEGGIKGDVIPTPIGSYSYDKWGGTCKAEVYVMVVTELLEEWEEDFRDREWVGLSTAMERIREPGLKEICARLPEFLAANPS